MSFWSAVVLIVAIVTIGEIYRVRFGTGLKAFSKPIENINNRINRLEERMANLETIVLEKEKEYRFNGLD